MTCHSDTKSIETRKRESLKYIDVLIFFFLCFVLSVSNIREVFLTFPIIYDMYIHTYIVSETRSVKQLTYVGYIRNFVEVFSPL